MRFQMLRIYFLEQLYWHHFTISPCPDQVVGFSSSYPSTKQRAQHM